MNRCLSFASIAACAAVCRAATVTVGGTPIGVTPTSIGYNAGNYFPGGNTAAWAEYSGVNAFRIFASAGTFEPDNPTGLRSGSGIATLQQFDARKAAVRADPRSTVYTDWATYDSRFANTTIPGANKIRLGYALGSLKGLGVAPILQMTRNPDSLDAWSDKWDQWHFYYAMAYKAASEFGVQQFQMFNEPDYAAADNPPAIAPDKWLVAMKLASDAVRSAVLDVNAKYGTNYKPVLSGPVTAGASKYADYGRPAVSTNRTDYAGRSVNYDVLGTYDMHRYSTTASAYVGDINAVRDAMTADSPTGTALPVTYTEFNSRTTASYAASTDTPDTPSMFTAVAGDVLGAMSAGVDGMYAFKFNQTPDSAVGGTAVQKTGFYYSDNTNAPYDTTGATLGAETMRLVARAFKGQRPRYAAAGAVSGNAVATSFDAKSGNYYVMGVDTNAGGTTTSYTLDVSAWGVAAGSVISVEEVSGRRHGEVVQLITVPAGRQVTINQPAQSVWLMTVPSGPAATSVALRPVGDAQVRNGAANRDRNYAADVYARVGRSDTDDTQDYASYLKFDLGPATADGVGRAILQVNGEVLSGSPVTFHVYALTGTANDWNAATLTWNNAPDLSGAADAKLAGVGDTAFPVGSLTYTTNASVSGLDVTEFLKNHFESQVTFVMIRESQFAGDVDGSYVRLSTSESATPPTLTLFAAVPEPATIGAIGSMAVLLGRRHRVPRSGTPGRV